MNDYTTMEMFLGELDFHYTEDEIELLSRYLGINPPIVKPYIRLLREVMKRVVERARETEKGKVGKMASSDELKSAEFIRKWHCSHACSRDTCGLDIVKPVK